MARMGGGVVKDLSTRKPLYPFTFWMMPRTESCAQTGGGSRPIAPMSVCAPSPDTHSAIHTRSHTAPVKAGRRGARRQNKGTVSRHRAGEVPTWRECEGGRGFRRHGDRVVGVALVGGGGLQTLAHSIFKAAAFLLGPPANSPLTALPFTAITKLQMESRVIGWFHIQHDDLELSCSAPGSACILSLTCGSGFFLLF